MLALAIGLNALATGCYIGAGLGPGPRDGLTTGLAARGQSIRVVRSVIEVSVLIIGFALGGTVGVGTIAYAAAIGPLVHLTIPRLDLAALRGRRSSARSAVPGLMIGVSVSTAAASGADPVGAARLAESLGFDFVSASDHPSGAHPTYETWTLLAWLAASTRRIGIASKVLSLPFRSPALVAKMAESLDRLSNGRLILGLGGGAADDELRGFGLPVPTAREKVDGMVEAVEIVRGLWSRPDFTYAGAVHQTAAAMLEPKAQRPVPIWLGTYGDRAVAATGRLADGWIPSLGYGSREELIVMRGKLLAAADAAGRDPAEIRCVLNVSVSFAGGTDAAIAGSPEQVTAELLGFCDIGFDGFNVMPSGERPDEVLVQFAAEVVPALRG
jgi:alkanesulfonate monooxygenase SsuD/methylene tetrahydromethanopterin reductase-like flavin-dependent oxidoreductase (luciferase family)